ncbi:MAG: outer membrane lipoprotein-sorting protein [Spirochaetales bacterium]|nr:outer membrane lipoprotein-sorting protein [Spirochaetales bacterium]
MKFLAKSALIALCLSLNSLYAITGDEIIEKADDLQSFDTQTSSGTMISHDRFGDITSTFDSWSRGDKEFLLEFTNVEEAGQKVLRVDDTMYLYDPDAEETIRLSGSALKDSLFGDVSYEDVSEGNDTLDKYYTSLEGTELKKGQECYVVELSAKQRTAPYYKQILWINKESYVLVYGEYYSKRDVHLKTIEVLDYLEVDDKFVISHMILRDVIKGDSHTELKLHDIKIDIELEDRLFTEEALF